MRYDAAIIGAGTNGLAAAAALAGAGLKTIVIERSMHVGGRAVTREFHPGHRASPYCDELAPIPTDIIRALGLARRGAIFEPSPSSVALWPDRRSEVFNWARDGAWERLQARATDCRTKMHRYGLGEASRVGRRRWLGRAPEPKPWPPVDSWAGGSIVACAQEWLADATAQGHLAAAALQGRAVDPHLGGSALHFLAPRVGSGTLTGGLGSVSAALKKAAEAAGAELTLGLEAVDICNAGRRILGVRLADGRQIEARAVVSTLDLRRTFYSLFAWNDLPQDVRRRVSAYRMSGSTARLLLALGGRPALDPESARGSIYVEPEIGRLARAYASWRSGLLPEHVPLSLRLVSASDPAMAPMGKATLTVTAGCVPYRLFDGAWTHGRRQELRARILTAIDRVLPGTSGMVVGEELLVPPDIEDQLGLPGGDLDGGDIAADQMFEWRAFEMYPGGRTPFVGLYLGGRSSPLGPLGTCSAGIGAARALLADRAAGRFA